MEDAGGLKPLQTHGSDSCHCPLLSPWSPGPYPALHSLPYSRAVTKSPWLGEAHIPPSPSTRPGAWMWEQKGSGLSPCPMAPWVGQEGRYHYRSLVGPQYILCATQQGAPATTTQESRAPQHGGYSPWGVHIHHGLEWWVHEKRRLTFSSSPRAVHLHSALSPTNHVASTGDSNRLTHWTKQESVKHTDRSFLQYSYQNGITWIGLIMRKH